MQADLAKKKRKFFWNKIVMLYAKNYYTTRVYLCIYIYFVICNFLRFFACLFFLGFISGLIIDRICIIVMHSCNRFFIGSLNRNELFARPAFLDVIDWNVSHRYICHVISACRLTINRKIYIGSRIVVFIDPGLHESWCVPWNYLFQIFVCPIIVNTMCSTVGLKCLIRENRRSQT